jgi:hypothetical protein
MPGIQLDALFTMVKGTLIILALTLLSGCIESNIMSLVHLKIREVRETQVPSSRVVGTTNRLSLQVMPLLLT